MFVHADRVISNSQQLPQILKGEEIFLVEIAGLNKSVDYISSNVSLCRCFLNLQIRILGQISLLTSGYRMHPLSVKNVPLRTRHNFSEAGFLKSMVNYALRTIYKTPVYYVFGAQSPTNMF